MSTASPQARRSVRGIAHDEHLTVVEHLDELRTRIVVSIVVLVIATAFCFWQNDFVLDVANRPLPPGFEPLTFSPTEPFFNTVKLATYAGILLALPALLFQAYAYILPAFSPRERSVALPFMLLAPVLFVAGAAFGYFVVMPAAIDFLLSFNADAFNIQIRASEYYGFFVLSLVAIGLLFQIPIGVLAVTRLGIVTPEQLADNRRYALLGIAVAAMLLPGTDPVTMILAMAPLYLLFELSLQLSKRFRASAARAREAEESGSD